MKIVLAIDSLKGCLTSRQAEEAAREGILRVNPGCEVCCLPVSDGGEGMLETFAAAGMLRRMSAMVHGPQMETLQADYGVSPDGRTAFIEMAAACGLPLVPLEKRNPMVTTTRGLGELMADAVLRRGCRRLLIGLGGSATSDAGAGMLQALGYQLTDRAGHELEPGGGALVRLAEVDAGGVSPLWEACEVKAACDVRNPLFGPQGAACVFAPQKGADARMVEVLDDGLRRFADVTRRVTGRDISLLPGAGAAGGVGGALAAYLGATLEPGIRLLLRVLDFDRHVTGADLVITGEGHADSQSLMGKVPAGVLEVAAAQRVPVALIAGRISDEEELKKAGFAAVCCINPPGLSPEEAMRPDYAAQRIAETVARLVEEGV